MEETDGGVYLSADQHLGEEYNRILQTNTDRFNQVEALEFINNAYNIIQDDNMSFGVKYAMAVKVTEQIDNKGS